MNEEGVLLGYIHEEVYILYGIDYRTDSSVEHSDFSSDSDNRGEQAESTLYNRMGQAGDSLYCIYLLDKNDIRLLLIVLFE
jgi:hypothetical protein